MSRWGKPTKNKKRINPRYHLNESLSKPWEEPEDDESREMRMKAQHSAGEPPMVGDRPVPSKENEDLTLKLIKTQGYNDAMDGAEPALPNNEAYMQAYGEGARDASLERQGHGMASRPMYESKWKEFIK